MKKTHFMGNLAHYIKSHKIKTLIIAIAVIVVIVVAYKLSNGGSTTTQYVVSKVQTGSITQTVTGSGQVSASNQTDLTSQVSGTVTGIYVKVGQSVKKGDLIATIDSKNALLSLENARVSHAKIVEPAKQSDILNSRNSVDKSYSDAYSVMATVYTDLPTIVTGMKDLLYSKDGFISDQKSTYLTTTARSMRDSAGIEFDSATRLYNLALQRFQATNRSTATSTLDSILSDTYDVVKAMSKAIMDSQSAINFIMTTQSEYFASESTSASSNVTSWLSKVNTDLGSIISARNTIDSNRSAYETLVNGADQYEKRQSELSLAQAEQAYANYFIRAPYDGVIGKISVSLYGQASGSIATIIGNDMTSSISLNEVDAAKVKVGQPVQITFDAIDGLNATGTVSEIELVGTVSQGVVSYPIKISISTADPRIRPGMSVNTTIITNQINDVIVVPSGAIKSAGQRKYVEILDVAQGQLPKTKTNSFTTTSETAPSYVTVTTGQSDDTNTVIESGLTEGQYVVTKTITSSSKTTTQTPSILSSFSNRRTTGTSQSNTKSSSQSGNTSSSKSSNSQVGAGGPPPF